MNEWNDEFLQTSRHCLSFGLLSVDKVSKVSKSKTMMDAEKFDTCIPVVSEVFIVIINP